MKKAILALAGAVLGGAAAAAPVSYWDPEAGNHAVCTNYTRYAGQVALTGGWWVVEGSFTNDSLITVSGEVHLLLADGAELAAQRGINVASGECLAIWAQSTNNAAGKLAARGGAPRRASAAATGARAGPSRSTAARSRPRAIAAGAWAEP